jgi:glycosyltransferase involved in cell wall biosynthesis
MRILHLTHQYLPEHTGGIELSTHSLASHLGRLGNTVGIVHRVSRPSTGREQRDGEVSVYTLWAGEMSPTRRFLTTFGNRELSSSWTEILSDFRPDIVHVHHLMGLPASFLAELQTNGIPFALTLHDYWWICPNATLLTNYSREICDGPRAHFNCSRCAIARTGTRLSWGFAPVLPFVFGWRRLLLKEWLKAAILVTAPSRFVRDFYIRRQ